MPVSSTPKEFENALKERRSRTTKAMDDLFRSPAATFKNHPNIGDLRKVGHLGSPLPAWIKNELKARGMVKPLEVRHIDQWPKAQKERLRKAMIHAIDNNVKIQFFWELYGGSREQTLITPDPMPTSGTITVTFLSPQSRVRVSSAEKTFGHIFVDVGS